MSLFQLPYKDFKFFPSLLQRLTFRVTSHKPNPNKATIQSLPNELLLEIFSFLELKPYIICHGVCRKWHELIPLTKMDPIRERLFDLYNCVLNTPGFEQAFEWTSEHLQLFDREEYIQCLLSQYPAIPEEFRMWILEWPARLAISSVWPGLPFLVCLSLRVISRRFGVNWIAYRPASPQLSALVYNQNTPSQMLIPALLLWRAATHADWLCFEQDKPNFFGLVFRNDIHYHPLGGIPELPLPEDDDPDLLVFGDWIDYLEDLWKGTSRMLRSSMAAFPEPDLSIPLPICFEFDCQTPDFLPTPSWSSSGTS